MRHRVTYYRTDGGKPEYMTCRILEGFTDVAEVEREAQRILEAEKKDFGYPNLEGKIKIKIEEVDGDPYKI